MMLDPKLVRAEEAMRDGFANAIDKDGAAMFRAFEGLAEEEAAIAVNLARLVINEVLKEIRPGGMTNAELRELGAGVARSDAWAEIDADTAATYLRELQRGEHPTTDAANTVALSIVCGGYLLAAFGPEEKPWGEYLNDVLDRIVSPEGEVVADPPR